MRVLRLRWLAVVLLGVAGTASAQTYNLLFNLGTYTGDTIEPALAGSSRKRAMAICTVPRSLVVLVRHGF